MTQLTGPQRAALACRGYGGQHYATFPEELPRRCILAGTSGHGACASCGAPWLREVETSYRKSPLHGPNSRMGKEGSPRKDTESPRLERVDRMMGWAAGCGCGAAEVVPCVVLDPFGGSGTTGLVARSLGRSSVLCELSGTYLREDMAPRLGGSWQEPLPLEVDAGMVWVEAQGEFGEVLGM